MAALLSFAESRSRSPDGVEIGVRIGGAGTETPLLLVAPPGARVEVFGRVAGHLGARRRVASWDLRGTFGSAEVGARREIGLAAHVADAERALDVAGLDTAAIVSWSLGAEIALEIAFTRPARVSALVLLSPVLGETFARTLGLPRATPLRRASLALRRAGPVGSRLRARISAWPGSEAWARRLGLAAETLDSEAWRALGERVHELDLVAADRLVQSLERAPATGALADVGAPALVVAGDADRYGGGLAARRLARALPLGELFTVKEATHLAHLEFPELVQLRIERFLAERAPR